MDVFFVISGFLITTLLLRERSTNGRSDLAGFWTRRARRLLPALALVVVTGVAAARLVSDNLLVNIHRQVLGAVTFSTNWIEIFAGFDYFDHSNPSLFATFWTLAVEEQFYLMWPLLFTGLFALTTSRRVLWRVAFALAVGSALLMAVLYTDPGSTTRVYYGTDTHSFGIMAGVALAFAFSEPIPALVSPRWQRLRGWVGFVATCALLVLVALIDSDSAFTYRGGIQLAAVLAAAVVAALPGDPAGFASMLDAKALVWIGRRSYGIYLWHWPVLLVITAAMPATAPGEPLGVLTVALVIVATLALSEASYRWIEVPVIRDGFRSTWRSATSRFTAPTAGAPIRRYWPLAALAVVGAIAAAGLVTAPRDSAAQRSVEAGQQAIDAQSEPDPTTQPTASTGDPGSAPSGSHDRGDPQTQAKAPTPTNAPEEPPPAWPAELAVPPGDQIVGLGDSVMSGAAPALYERFPGIYLDAEPIRRWTDAPATVQSMLDAATMRPVVVLNYGTNAGLESDAAREALRTVLDMLGPQRRVVLVTVVGVSSWVPDSNQVLRDIGAEHPNTIVAAWHDVVAKRPGLLHEDRTHPNVEGISVYAELIAQSLQQLGPG